MSVDEHIKKDEVKQEKDFKAEISSDKKRLGELRDFSDLRDDPLFKQWLLTYVVDPLRSTFTSDLTETDTNKSFINKGKLKAYNKQSKWMDDVSAQIKSLVESIHRKEVDLYKDEESQKPEN